MSENDHGRPSPVEFISMLSELDPSLKKSCVNGSCYKFHLVLECMFHDAIPYMNAQRDHVVSKIGSDLYDISGRLPKKRHSDYHEMSPKEIEVASKWSYRKRSE